MGSPFWVDGERTASKLKLYKIELEYDLIVDSVGMSWGSVDHMIKEFGQLISDGFKI